MLLKVTVGYLTKLLDLTVLLGSPLCVGQCCTVWLEWHWLLKISEHFVLTCVISPPYLHISQPPPIFCLETAAHSFVIIIINNNKHSAPDSEPMTATFFSCWLHPPLISAGFRHKARLCAALQTEDGWSATRCCRQVSRLRVESESCLCVGAFVHLPASVYAFCLIYYLLCAFLLADLLV